MSLINYVEPINIGNIFVGIGWLLLCVVVAVIFYRIYSKIAQAMDISINRSSKYELLEGSFLDKIGKEKGIDLEKELIRRKMFQDTKRKSFRKKIEEQIYDDMFGKEKKE